MNSPRQIAGIRQPGFARGPRAKRAMRNVVSQRRANLRVWAEMQANLFHTRLLEENRALRASILFQGRALGLNFEQIGQHLAAAGLNANQFFNPCV